MEPALASAVLLFLLGVGGSHDGPTGLFPAGGCQNTPCHWLNSRQIWDVVDCEGSCRWDLLPEISLQGVTLHPGQLLMVFALAWWKRQ